MYKKFRICLSDEEKEYISKVKCSPHTSLGIIKRCDVLTMADESSHKAKTKREIADLCSVCDVTVYNIIKSYCENGLKATLSIYENRAPRRKTVVDAETELKIIKLVHQNPPKGHSRWSVRLLTEKIIELKLVPTIGRETIRKILKKNNIIITKNASVQNKV